MKLVTASQMRDLDRFAIDHGMPSLALMENAGRAVAREALRAAAEAGARSVEVVCGPGNNGGDGFVAARHAAVAGLKVRIILACDAERLSDDAGVNFRLALDMGLPVVPCETSSVERGAVAVDALLGTGAKGAPRGLIGQAVQALAVHEGPVVSVDVPSGVDADTGRVEGPAVMADCTVTFGFPKPGLLVFPGASHVGSLVVDPIGYAWDRAIKEMAGSAPDMEWFDAVRAEEALPERPPAGHKGCFGHVLIIGGSLSMPGAPALAARAALLSGAGLVSIAAPAAVQPIVARYHPEAMCHPLPDCGGALTPESLTAAAPALDRADVVCLGPGLSLSEGAQDFARQLVETCPKPMVVDADALTAISGFAGTGGTREACATGVARRHAATILTPHPGECGRLLGVGADAVQSDRFAAVRETADRYGATVVLKGARTLVHGRDGRGDRDQTAVVTVGNSGMATGGSGDVLTGVIGAMLAQGCSPYNAAALGAYAHGRAGDLAADQVGEHGVTAGAIAERLPEALRELSESKQARCVR